MVTLISSIRGRLHNNGQMEPSQQYAKMAINSYLYTDVILVLCRCDHRRMRICRRARDLVRGVVVDSVTAMSD